MGLNFQNYIFDNSYKIKFELFKTNISTHLYQSSIEPTSQKEYHSATIPDTKK